jgi:hypothetical protein
MITIASTEPSLTVAACRYRRKLTFELLSLSGIFQSGQLDQFSECRIRGKLACAAFDTFFQSEPTVFELSENSGTMITGQSLRSWYLTRSVLSTQYDFKSTFEKPDGHEDGHMPDTCRCDTVPGTCTMRARG